MLKYNEKAKIWEVDEAPVDPLRDKQCMHRLELREPLLHLIGDLSNANLEIAISFGLDKDDFPLISIFYKDRMHKKSLIGFKI